MMISIISIVELIPITGITFFHIITNLMVFFMLEIALRISVNRNI